MSDYEKYKAEESPQAQQAARRGKLLSYIQEQLGSLIEANRESAQSRDALTALLSKEEAVLKRDGLEISSSPFSHQAVIDALSAPDFDRLEKEEDYAKCDDPDRLAVFSGLKFGREPPHYEVRIRGADVVVARARAYAVPVAWKASTPGGGGFVRATPFRVIRATEQGYGLTSGVIYLAHPGEDYKAKGSNDAQVAAEALLRRAAAYVANRVE